MLPMIATYLMYLVFSLAITFWVGHTLFTNGRVFLIEIFEGNVSLADSVNRLMIVGYYLVIISINKPDPEFYKLVYGGMLARVAVVFGFSIFMISQNHVAMVPFMLFLMLFYTMHQWVEISGWLKELPTRKVQLNS